MEGGGEAGLFIMTKILNIPRERSSETRTFCKNYGGWGIKIVVLLQFLREIQRKIVTESKKPHSTFSYLGFSSNLSQSTQLGKGQLLLAVI